VAGEPTLAPELPDSIKLRMSFLVTRPLMPVPSSPAISTPCSSAIRRTSGLDLVRRSSSAVRAELPLSGVELAGELAGELCAELFADEAGASLGAEAVAAFAGGSDEPSD